jgi:RNA polymerase sigma-70 factor (ECF subfamily)
MLHPSTALPGNGSFSADHVSGPGRLPPDNALFRDDELFLRKAFGEDPKEACGLLFKRYHQVLCNQAVRLVYSREVAEDLVAEVFYRFWKNKTYLDITTSYRAYLFKAVRHRAYNHLKAELTHKALAREVHLEAELRQPDQHLFFTELSRKLESLVEALPPQCRKVFLMNRYEGKKHQEIADSLDLSVRTVAVHLGRAVAALRKGLRESHLLGLLLLLWAGR